MPRVFLQRRQQEVFEKERLLANELLVSLSGFKSLEAYASILRKTIASLDELFLLVVMGEFNSGKSTFINALLGSKVILEEGNTPTTEKITIVCFGEQEQIEAIDQDTLKHSYPSDFLRNICIVDTPGFNAIFQKHDLVTREFIPQGDLILFLIYSKQVFSQSQHRYLEQIRFWKTDTIIIINGIDDLQPPEDLPTVIDFARSSCRELLGFDPPIFAVSSLQAKQAQMDNNKADKTIELWGKSQFQGLITSLNEKLQEAERVRGKLRRPLLVMQSLHSSTRENIAEYESHLNEDEITISTIREKLNLYVGSIKRDFPDRLSKIELVVLDMHKKGNDFFDDTIRPGRFLDLIHSERVRADFERDVIGNSGDRIEKAVQNQIDWLVEEELKLWQDITDYTQQRRQASVRRYNKASETMNRQYANDRRNQLKTLVKSARDIVNNYKHQEEAQKLSERLWKSVVGTISAGIGSIGSIGLGPAMIAIVGAPIAGIGSFVVGGVLVIFTLSIIPRQRTIAKQQFDMQMRELQQALHDALDQEFEKELNETVHQVNTYLKPYEDFVNAEKEKVLMMNNQLNELGKKMASLMIEIENLH
jgi:GTPase Era involved in 16S rRNA processing/uncharacterized protein YlxW (UPF0749 family)